MNYVLVTPLKNEENYVLKLKETVFNQTLRPICWVIVDSGSEDNTFNLSKEIAHDNEWVHIVKQKKFFEKGYGHINIAEAINEGYNFAKGLHELKKVDYNYIGITDATPILCKNYFEVLLREMEKNEKLAITCGIQKLNYNNKNIDLKELKNISGTGFNNIRLYKKEFFSKIGAYPLTPSSDSVLLLKAINRQWETKIINEVYFIKPRIGGSKIGLWKGSKLKGKSMYILGYHPLLALGNSIVNSVKIPPHYQFLPMLWGYFLSLLKREEKVVDDEIREYYGKKRLREIINNVTGGKIGQN
jgi:glycosyltransferase involved in cell wall biosynthesis